MRKTPRKKASRQTRKQIQVGGQTPTVFSGKNYTTYFAGVNPLNSTPTKCAAAGATDSGVAGGKYDGCISRISDGLIDKNNNIFVCTFNGNVVMKIDADGNMSRVGTDVIIHSSRMTWGPNDTWPMYVCGGEYSIAGDPIRRISADGVIDSTATYSITMDKGIEGLTCDSNHNLYYTSGDSIYKIANAPTKPAVGSHTKVNTGAATYTSGMSITTAKFNRPRYCKFHKKSNSIFFYDASNPPRILKFNVVTLIVTTVVTFPNNTYSAAHVRIAIHPDSDILFYSVAYNYVSSKWQPSVIYILDTNTLENKKYVGSDIAANSNNPDSSTTLYPKGLSRMECFVGATDAQFLFGVPSTVLPNPLGFLAVDDYNNIFFCDDTALTRFYMTSSITEPIPPTTLSFTTATGNSVTISWSSDTGASSYIFTITPSGSPLPVVPGRSTTATFTGLQECTIYTITIAPKNRLGTATPKSITCLTTFNNAVLQTPLTSSVTLVSDPAGVISCLLSWTGFSSVSTIRYTLTPVLSGPSGPTGPSRATGPTGADLPAGWFQATDPSSGRLYYYREGSESTFIFPEKGPQPELRGSFPANTKSPYAITGLEPNVTYRATISGVFSTTEQYSVPTAGNGIYALASNSVRFTTKPLLPLYMGTLVGPNSNNSGPLQTTTLNLNRGIVQDNAKNIYISSKTCIYKLSPPASTTYYLFDTSQEYPTPVPMTNPHVGLPASSISLFAGSPTVTGEPTAGQSNLSIRFTNICGMTFHNNALYVTDYSYSVVVKIPTVAPNTPSLIGGSPSFNNPREIIRGIDNNLYIADFNNNCISVLNPTTNVISKLLTTPSGTLSVPYPSSLVQLPDGSFYVACTMNHTIQKLTPTPSNPTTYSMSLFAGTLNTSGNTDGPNLSAKFDSPNGLALDSANNLYVYDSGNFSIRIIIGQTVYRYLGGASGNTDGPASSANFRGNSGMGGFLTKLFFDTNNNLYLSDGGNGSLRAITNYPVDQVITDTQLTNYRASAAQASSAVIQRASSAVAQVASSALAEAISGARQSSAVAQDASSALAQVASSAVAQVASSALAERISGAQESSAVAQVASSALAEAISGARESSAVAQVASSALAQSISGAQASSALAEAISGARESSAVAQVASSALAEAISGARESSAVAQTASSSLAQAISGARESSAVAQEASSALAQSISGAEASSATAQQVSSALAEAISGARESSAVAQVASSALAEAISGARESSAVAQTASSSLAQAISGARESSAVAQEASSALAQSISGAQASSATAQQASSALAQSISGAEASSAVAQVASSAVAEAISGARESSAVAQVASSALAEAISGARESSAVAQTASSALAQAISGARESSAVAQEASSALAQRISGAEASSAVAQVASSALAEAISGARESSAVAQIASSAVAQVVSSAVAQQASSALAQSISGARESSAVAQVASSAVAQVVSSAVAQTASSAQQLQALAEPVSLKSQYVNTIRGIQVKIKENRDIIYSPQSSQSSKNVAISNFMYWIGKMKQEQDSLRAISETIFSIAPKYQDRTLQTRISAPYLESMGFIKLYDAMRKQYVVIDSNGYLVPNIESQLLTAPLLQATRTSTAIQQRGGALVSGASGTLSSGILPTDVLVSNDKTIPASSPWKAYFDPDRRVYFYVNSDTNVSQFEHPFPPIFSGSDTIIIDTTTKFLPESWIKLKNPSIDVPYYFNIMSTETLWVHPNLPPDPSTLTPVADATLNSPYEKYIDPATNRSFYVNTLTQESQWNFPDEAFNTGPSMAQQASSALAEAISGARESSAVAQVASSALAEAISGARESSAVAQVASSALAQSISGARESSAVAQEASSALAQSISGAEASSAVAQVASSAVAEAISGARESSAVAQVASSALAEAISGARESSAVAQQASSAVAESISGAQASSATAQQASSALAEAISGARESSAVAQEASSSLAQAISGARESSAVAQVASSALAEAISGAQASSAVAQYASRAQASSAVAQVASQAIASSAEAEDALSRLLQQKDTIKSTLNTNRSNILSMINTVYSTSGGPTQQSLTQLKSMITDLVNKQNDLKNVATNIFSFRDYYQDTSLQTVIPEETLGIPGAKKVYDSLRKRYIVVDSNGSIIPNPATPATRSYTTFTMRGGDSVPA